MRRLIPIALLLVFASCGGGDKQPSVPPSLELGRASISVQSSDGSGIQQAANEPASQSLGVALGELDALQTPEGVDAALFEELKDALRGALVDNPPGRRGSLAPLGEEPGWLARPTPGGKFVSQPPGDASKPYDLTLAETGGGNEYVLTWHEVNIGDYDNKGTVGISDITPLAMHYGEYVTDRNSQAALVDTSGNFIADIADITGIAMNYGNELAGYNIYIAGLEDPMPNVDGLGDLSVMRPLALGTERLAYSYDLTLSVLFDVIVVTADASGEEGIASDPAILSSGAAPLAPLDLVATAGEGIGVGKIELSWTANTEDDLLEYRVYRRAGADDYLLAAYVLPASEPSYTDGNGAGLLDPGVLYSYYVVAVNTVGMASEHSAEAADTPFYPPPPLAPEWIEAEGTDDGIDVTWGAVESDYLAGCEVWRCVPGETNFWPLQTVSAGVTDIVDSDGLVEGESYDYKVRAFDSYERYSVFTDVASAAYNPTGELVIVSVETDRTMLQVDSGERAQLTVVVSDTGADITWEVPEGEGSFEGGYTGASVTYAPPDAGGARHVTVTVTAVRGSDTADDSIQLIITTLPNLGAAPDFSLLSFESPAEPRPFSYYLNEGKVILLNFGGIG